MKYSRLLIAVAFLATSLAILNACVGFEESDKTEVSIVSPAPALVPEGVTLSGSYLAGRFAQRQQDWDAAQKYINTVIGFDDKNQQLEQRAFLLSLGAGQYSRAKRLAEKIIQGKEGSDLSLIYLACEALSRNDFNTAISFTNRLPSDGFGQYTKPLLTAWSYVGLGRLDDAIKLLQESASAEDPTYNFHVGLIEEMRGNNKAALERYEAAVQNGLTLHTAVMAARFFEKNGRADLTAKIYDKLGSAYPLNPFIAGLKRQDLASSTVARPSEGAGIALFDLASLLYERRSYDSAQVYGSLVQMLMPQSDFVMMMMGDIAVLSDRYEKAIASYDGIPKSSALYWMSRMRVAEVHEAAGQPERAVTLLSDLAKSPETRLPAMAALGDVYRHQEKFKEAIASYDAALVSVDEQRPEFWGILYARGMSRERLNEWDQAEKDLMVALKSQPDNAMILNFIGYAWAEKGVNLDRALEFTRRAAELKPDDGFILDSYGWALYRKGNYAEAVKVMERAVGEVPDEAVMLDHLGDAYWQVGRKNEARFKWRHAQEVSSDKNFKALVAKKLKDGIIAPAALAAHQANSIQ